MLPSCSIEIKGKEHLGCPNLAKGLAATLNSANKLHIASAFEGTTERAFISIL
jgi:hypothetical protein